MDIEIELKKMWAEIGKLKSYPVLLDHYHNGMDASPIDFKNISQKKIWVPHTIISTNAATAANYGVFYVAPQACIVTAFYEAHQALGTDGGAVTVTLEKLTSGVAPDSGSVVLDSALSLKTTINTVQTGTVTRTSASRTLAKGDRLCLKDAGVLTSVSNVTVLVELTIL